MNSAFIPALQASTAEGMVLDQHLDAHVPAVDSALVTEENRHRMLGAWIRGNTYKKLTH